MISQKVQRLKEIKTFPSLVKYLRDELDWPIESDDFEELTYEYEAEELGIDAKTAVKIKEIKQLRPLSSKQPWGIFFINFEPKQLPIVVLRRILRSLVIKKRASANKSQQAAWKLHDLLFISSYGEDAHREITFAHFSEPTDRLFGDLPTLRVLGWDDDDTKLKIDHVVHTLTAKLCWPQEENDTEAWRSKWSDAFELRPREVITTSKELALRLAALAKSIRNRANLILSVESERGALRKLHKAFQTALIHDLNEDDFADMYAQTIAYGLLAARVSRPEGVIADNLADMIPTNPFLRDMLGTFLTVGGRKGKIDFDELGIQEVVDLLNSPNTHIEAVLRDFGKRTMQEDPVVHFYELFLKEYDKKKKVERGVFYTPQPVVSYIVRSIHELLKTEFGLEDGLASTVTWDEMVTRNSEIKMPEGVSPDEPFVMILDIATGTATFMVEIIEVIYNTMVAKWKKEGCLELQFQQLWNEYVPKYLLPRLFGFELMMAPYAIAHMKIGLKLAETGYRFGSNERAHIYLTNSLEPPENMAEQPQFEEMAPALAHEAKAVNAVKRKKLFTVVVGNPPYSGVSANLSPVIRKIIDPYRFVDGIRIKEKGALQFEKNLNDDYVKFLRFGESLIEKSLGILGYITNNGFLESATLRGMRSHFLDAFQKLYFFDLHGDSDRKEIAQDGSSDENVFDIKHGVSISLLVRSRQQSYGSKGCAHRFDLKGPRELKYGSLLRLTFETTHFLTCSSLAEQYFFKPHDSGIASEYEQFLSIARIFGVNSTGFESGRDEILTDFSAEELKAKLQRFCTAPAQEIKHEFSVEEAWGARLFNLRHSIIKDADFSKRFMTFLFCPFDFRACYYKKDLLKTNSFSAGKHLCYGENIAFIAMRQVSLDAGYSHIGVTRYIPNNRCFYSTKGKISYFPLYLFSGENDLIRQRGDVIGSNITEEASAEISRRLGLKWHSFGDSDLMQTISPQDAIRYVFAVTYSPTYRTRYSEFLRTDFPRVPLTNNLVLLRALTKLGSDLIDLHLMESPKLDKHITCFVGKGMSQIEKVSYSDKTAWIDKEKSQGFQGVPENIWNFQIGGYQVCEKWLKDRGPKGGKPGRTLSADDINHYHRIVVALNETIRIMAEIDKVIEAHGGWPGAFTDKMEAKAEWKVQAEPLLKAAEELSPYKHSEKVSAEDETTDDPSDDQSGGKNKISLQKVTAADARENNVKERLFNSIDDTAREDIMAIIREVFAGSDNSAGLDRDSAIREISRVIGFERTGPRIKETLSGDLIAAVRRGILLNEKGLLKIDCKTMADYPRDLLKEYLLTVMGSAWWDQEDAIRAAARHLGFRRTGSTIQEAFKSVINGLLRQDILERDGNNLRKRASS